jgi:hypothetical protein
MTPAVKTIIEQAYVIVRGGHDEIRLNGTGRRRFEYWIFIFLFEITLARHQSSADLAAAFDQS